MILQNYLNRLKDGLVFDEKSGDQTLTNGVPCYV